MSLYVTKAHPNPIGKDRLSYQAPSNEKLNEEWVEFTNTSNQAVDLQGTAVQHRTFNQRCDKTGYDELMSFKGQLQPVNSVRVHTGSGTPWQEGAVWHFYAGRRNFAWNNDCGDQVVLTRASTTLDWAEYDPNPSEGVVLKRLPHTNKLR
jgi:hypothetical protein